MGGSTAPIFVSNDGGRTWALRSTVPSATDTGDISPRFGGNGRLYTGILKNPGDLLLNILRTANAAGATPMGVLSNRNSVDQPFLATVTLGVKTESTSVTTISLRRADARQPLTEPWMAPRRRRRFVQSALSGATREAQGRTVPRYGRPAIPTGRFTLAFMGGDHSLRATR
jgi:hypothetical protein